MKRCGHIAISVLIWTIVAAPGDAYAQAQPLACSATPYRQFDFWLGEWEVTNPSGEVVGTNTIRRILNGCVLHEHWTGASGGSGQSHNIYDLPRDGWHQTWVDDSGRLLQLDGGIAPDGRMVMQGATRGDQGEAILNEISWEALDGGRVRQVWRISRDGGSEWQVVFDGLYSPKN